MLRISASTFDGKPCRVCEGTLRYLSNRKCVACRKQAVERHFTPAKRKEYKDRYRGRYQQKTRTQKILNMSHDTFALLMARQDGKCAICKQPPKPGKRLFIDHCHSTGHFRGLLCGNCNTGIGMLRDDPALIRAAVDYLENNEWAL
jgi:hypothetical protein